MARLAGLVLDDWQAYVLEQSFGERADGKWAAFEVGLCVPRQNGKGAILEAMELAGLFLLGERLIIHSAHEFATSQEAFRRLEALIQDTPELHRRVKGRGGYRHSHGDEGIHLRSGQRIQFRTRTKGGGRGFTGDRVILDEAMILAEAFHGALMPTVSARSINGNPQVVYTGSAVDQMIHEHGLVFSRVRARGVEGKDEGLAYFEWSVDSESPDALNLADAADPDLWYEANPGLGIRIAPSHVERERKAMAHRTFAVERCNVGDWPAPDGSDERPIDPEEWANLVDRESEVLDPVWFALDVPPDRSWGSIGAAGKRRDGLSHLEVVDRRSGTGWMVDRACELVANHGSAGVVVDGKGPAGSLVPELEARGVAVRVVNAAEHAQGCGLLVDAVNQETVRHLGTDELSAAVKGATKRPLGDAWAWARRSSTVDISPLVACTLAFWACETQSVGGGLVLA